MQIGRCCLGLHAVALTCKLSIEPVILGDILNGLALITLSCYRQQARRESTVIQLSLKGGVDIECVLPRRPWLWVALLHQLGEIWLGGGVDHKPLKLAKLIITLMQGCRCAWIQR